MNLRKIVSKYGESFIPTLSNEVIKLGKENPEFVYNTSGGVEAIQCKYNGPPVDTKTNEIAGPPSSGCIFGQALTLMGWDDADEKDSQWSIVDILQDNTDLSIEKHHVFESVQDLQDRGMSWGKCIKPLEE